MYDEVVSKLTEMNSFEYTCAKLAEECVEFNKEVLDRFYTKPLIDNTKSFTEEAGDLFLRFELFMEKLKKENPIMHLMILERRNEKLGKYSKLIDKYNQV